MSTTEEVRDTELEFGEGAYTIGTPEEPFNKDGNIVERIAAKRAELGYKDDDGLVFTVPVINNHSDGKVTRLVTDIQNGKFKRVK